AGVGAMAAVTSTTATTSTTTTPTTPTTAAQPPSSIPPAIHTCELRVTCGSPEEALILRNTLAVDPELQPDKLVRVITVHDTHVSVSFSCPDARLLRACLHGLAHPRCLHHFPRHLKVLSHHPSSPSFCSSFSCPDARLLRAAFNAFMDSLILAARTIEAFGPSPPMQQPCLQ
ncbi:unnamed protein product, partial [Closterium sp. NIES-65]